MTSFTVAAAVRALKSKIGTGVAFAALQRVAPEVTRQEWDRAIGQARAALTNRVAEMTRPLNRRPIGTEIIPYDSKRATGFLQQIDVFVRDRDTGLIESRPYTIRTNTLRSRASVVAEGLSRYREAVADDPENYPEDVLGAWYAGTLELIPKP